ncbi:hypothetical protein [Methylocucumis oryzae]|uniref:Restriction endonuclease subunit R n=1 Tax=Methylocucumis oryzae TaxID=1632867 RepID=A0A0F3IEG4_9GAMM|nr:hypothetical protein [Methylocucumis oryzae]KJV05195.1 hypothetical protein VZ94_20020 [Methylocucumis oryzae]
MKTGTFKQWTLTELDNAFALKQTWDSVLMQKWEAGAADITVAEKEALLKLQKTLIRGGRAWNEVELENKFISPVIMIADIDDEEIGYFLERNLSGVVGDYELSGVVDGMIATGFRDPGLPLFCLHEYKRSIENQGSPDAQVLAAMLVAREKNDNKLPIYGLFVIGLVWNFIVLEGNQYCISREYKATDDELFEIFQYVENIEKNHKSRADTNRR